MAYERDCGQCFWASQCECENGCEHFAPAVGDTYEQQYDDELRLRYEAYERIVESAEPEWFKCRGTKDFSLSDER